MPATLRSVLLDHYGRHPERVYLRCVMPDGASGELTYGRLVERGSVLARIVAERHVAPGAVVIVLLPHSTDLYAAFFGAVLGGFVPSILSVPSFKLNAAHYRNELAALCGRIAAGALITDTATAEQLGLGSGDDALAGADLLLVDRMAETCAAVPDVTIAANDLALLQHSSGSTGLKKGVALSHRAVLAQIDAYAPTIGLREDDRIASWLPLYHDMGLIACAVLPAVAGVPVTALSPFHWVTRPATLLRAIHDDRCTLAWLPNFAYDFLATRVRDSQIEGVRLDTMRAFINCSEPTLARSHRRFLERYAPLGVREDALWTCYAAAETTFAISQSTAAFPPRVESIDRERFLSAGDAAPVTDSDGPSMEMLSGGSVLPGTEVRIVGAEGRELPDRRVGEIAIRSTSLFSGYLKQPDETAQVLRDGWYDSGDLGYQADGHLFVTGRKKDLIIVAGRNYYPQDVECIVSEVRGIHPGRVVALGVDDAAIGTQRLVVLAEVDDPALLDSVELAGRVRAAVAEDLDCAIDDLRLLPHMWLLKTSSGKIARRPSLERYLQELPPSR
jgi:acyl-CoA synthetase (AMP-forming)/AMP-acid ligase II